MGAASSRVSKLGSARRLAEIMTEHARAVMMAIDEDPESLARTCQELEKRYGADYDVVCEASPMAALRLLEEMAERGRPVAIVLADLRLEEMSGSDLLGRVSRLHPTAKRALSVVGWEDRAALMPMMESLTQGSVDYFVVKPTESVREFFHRTISEFLDEWARTTTVWLEAVRMVGEGDSPRTRELLDLLQRNNVPCTFLTVDSDEGKDLLARSGVSSERLPVLVFFDGTVLIDPSLEEIAASLGARAKVEEDRYDILIVGAGPAGLGAAVYAASEGLHTLVVEREAMGGQAGTTSLIRNYLGFPRGLSGSELALRAYEQAILFGTEFDFGRETVGLRPDGEEKVVVLSDGSEARARAVIVASGMSYRRLDVPGLEGLIGRGVFYGAAVSEAKSMQGREVFVVGGGNSAGQAAVHLARYASRVTVLVRADSLAASMSDYLISQIAATPNVEIRFGTRVAEAVGEGRLEGVVLEDGSGRSETVPAGGLFIFIGARPRTGWLPDDVLRDEGGFILTGNDLLRDGAPPPGWRLARPPLLLEASLPGVFAAGDVRHGSVKRVASAVGEGATALQACHAYLETLQTESRSLP